MNNYDDEYNEEYDDETFLGESTLARLRNMPSLFETPKQPKLEMSDEEINRIMGLAKYATRIICHKWDAPPDVQEDCIQASILRLLKRGYKDDNRYIYVVCKSAILDYLVKWYKIDSYGHIEIDDEDIHMQLIANNPDWLFITREQLIDLFLSARQKKGQRGLKASETMADICQLLMTGYFDNQEIADKLGLTYLNVKKYRRQIKHVLRLYLRDDSLELKE